MPSTPPPSLPGGLELRPVDVDSPAELLAWRTNAALVFKDSTPVTPELMAWRRPDYDGQRLTAVWDGDEAVGTFRSWDTGLTVPGGRVTADAVSSVTVRPTHRRRGLLSAMMRADLEAAAARGVPAAVLVASEAGIYGRFGFGPATTTSTWWVDVRAARVRDGVPTDGTTRVVRPEAFVQAAGQVFEASRRPGAIDLSARWWEVRAGISAPPGPPPRSAVHVVHTGSDGREDGVLRYTVKDDWQERTCRTVVEVDLLVAATDAAYADLVRYLVGLDTVERVRLEERPLDEPLPALLTDRRAARVHSVCDLLWARLLDVPAALAARTYEHDVDVVLAVRDGLGHAEGTWRLRAGPDGSTCEATDAPADVVLPVDVLSSAWLGGGDLLADAAAGRVEERTPRALAALAAALRTAGDPWVWTWF